MVEKNLFGIFIIICKTYRYFKLFGNLTHMTIFFSHVATT